MKIQRLIFILILFIVIFGSVNLIAAEDTNSSSILSFNEDNTEMLSNGDCPISVSDS